jgi:hypothetical protein
VCPTQQAEEKKLTMVPLVITVEMGIAQLSAEP